MIELADIAVEDIKAGYVLHDPTFGVWKVERDAWDYEDKFTGRQMVDLYLEPAGWLTYERGEIVQVEA